MNSFVIKGRISEIIKQIKEMIKENSYGRK